MPSTNKTSNFNLNNWISTDKPKREDFVADNIILDTVLNAHFTDTDKHFSQSDRELLNSPFVVGSFAGDGNDSCTHTLSFSPKFIFIFLYNNPLVKYDSTNGYNIYNAGMACYNGYGASLGVSMNGAQITLQQTKSTPNNGNFINLNKNLGQYIYVAFK